MSIDRSKSKLKNSSVLSLCLPLDAAPVAAAVGGVRVPELEAELVEVARLGARLGLADHPAQAKADPLQLHP